MNYFPTPPALGTFVSRVEFSSGKIAMVVYSGGTVDQLDAAMREAGAAGAWAQGENGKFFIYIVDGGFVNDAFRRAFRNGFHGLTALTLIGK